MAEERTNIERHERQKHACIKSLHTSLSTYVRNHNSIHMSAYLFRASGERTCFRLRCFGKMSMVGIRSGRGGKVGIYSPQAGRSPTTSFLPRAAHSRDPSSKPKLLRQPPPLTTRRRWKFRRSNLEPCPCRWGCTNPPPTLGRGT